MMSHDCFATYGVCLRFLRILSRLAVTRFCTERSIESCKQRELDIRIRDTRATMQ